MTLSFLPNNAFPLPAPITPKLVALGLDDKTAATVSKVYLSAALSLKETCEAEYIRACNAFMATSDNRGHSSKELRSKLLTVTITRYMQALSKWVEEATQKADASLLRRKKRLACQPKVKNANGLSSEHSRKSKFAPSCKQDGMPAPKPCPFNTTSPSHAFPHAYPPPVRSGPVSFVTHIPLLERKRRPEREPKATSDCGLDACISALARLSLGPSQGLGKPTKTVPKPRSRTHPTSNLKPTSQLSPSRPRLVSPSLDTSVAVSQKIPPKNTPCHSSPTNIPRVQNIDIPRSNRRKVCSIPYRRPATHPSTSPSSPSSPSFSRSIRRTPSLTSDHGSEASSPSTPPDFSSMAIPTSTLACKGSFSEATSPLDHSPARHSWWHGIDFGTDVYG